MTGHDNAALLKHAAVAGDKLEALLGFAKFMVAQTEYPHLAGFMLEVNPNAKRDAESAILFNGNDCDGLIIVLKTAAAADQIDPELDPVKAATGSSCLSRALSSVPLLTAVSSQPPRSRCSDA